MAALDFQEELRDAFPMNKAEHAKRLRQAIAASSYTREDVMDATGKTYRTVSNWVSETKPMMPAEVDRVILRRMFPGYDDPGDQVELAVRRSRLTEDRQYDVIGYYKRRLREQDEDVGRRGA